MHWRAMQRIWRHVTIAVMLLLLPVACYAAHAAGICPLCNLGLCPCC